MIEKNIPFFCPSYELHQPTPTLDSGENVGLSYNEMTVKTNCRRHQVYFRILMNHHTDSKTGEHSGEKMLLLVFHK